MTVSVRALASAVQSTLFLSLFPTLYMAVVCLHRKVFTVDHRSLYLLAGVVSSLTIFIERKSRRAELALYAMPRGADTLFFILRHRKWLISIPYAIEMLFSLSMGLVLYFHQHEPETLNPYFNKILSIFVPPNTPPKDSPKRSIADTPKLDTL